MNNIEKRKESIWDATAPNLNHNDELIDELARYGFFYDNTKNNVLSERKFFHCCHCSESVYIYNKQPRTKNEQHIKIILRDDRQRKIHKRECPFNPDTIEQDGRNAQNNATQRNTVKPRAVVETRDGRLFRVYTNSGRIRATEHLDAHFLSKIAHTLATKGLYCSAYNRNVYVCEFVCCSCNKLTVYNVSSTMLQQHISYELDTHPEHFHDPNCTFNHFKSEDKKANLAQPENEGAAAAQNNPNRNISHIPDDAMQYLKCYSCKDKQLNFVAYTPCFHVCQCKDCTANLFKQHHPLCPICNTEIKGTENIYIYAES